MAGSVFQVGEQRIRPGVYIRVTDVGEPPEAIVPQGTVAALFRASWGPLGKVVTMENAEAIGPEFGDSGTVDVPREAFRGGCRRVLGFRLGTGGAKATVTLKDTATTPVDAVKLEVLYEGVRGNDFTVTVRDSLADETKRELLLYEGVTLRQTVEFTKGAEEPQALIEAIKASNSPWITATKIAEGSGTLAVVAQAPFTGGEDPTVTGKDYSAGLLAIEALSWNVLCIDSDDAVTHAVVQTYIDRVRNEGKRVIGVVGEPTSVAMATRFANARAFNDPAIVYVANGFKGSDGVTREGYLAAARVAGMIAGSQITDSLTHAVVRGATEIVGALTNAEIEQAIQSGALVFTMSAQKQVHIEYGINTFVTVTADYDAGWKKIRRVKTRDNLIDRITFTWDPLIGKINNSPDGRATLIAAAQGIINKMVTEGALLGGTFMEDPNNPPAGDSAWFVAHVDDLDGAEKTYIAFGFRFSPGFGPIFGEVS
jgi:hypothetical protein